MTGFEFDTVKTALESLGAEVVIENAYGVENWAPPTKGFWDNDILIGSLYCCITPFVHASFFHLESSTPFWVDRECLLAKKDPPVEDWSKVIKPFNLSTWIGLASTMIVVFCGLLIWLCLERDKSELKTWGNVLSCTLAPLIFQSGSWPLLVCLTLWPFFNLVIIKDRWTSCL